MNAPSDNQNKPRLSIIVPAYNEAERIGPTLRSIEAWLRAQDFACEVLLVDDGSADETASVALSAWEGDEFRVVTQEVNMGKGAAIRRGMLEARGDWRLFTDADNSTPIDEVEAFWPLTEQGFDVCIGSRALPDSRLEERQPFYREWMGRTFNVMVRLIAVSGLCDTQCGFKLFSRRAAEAVFPRQTLEGFAFDVECLMLARGLGLRIAEAPVRWINSPASRVSALSDSFEMFSDLVRLRRLHGKNGCRVRHDG